MASGSGRRTSGYYRDELGRLAPFYDRVLGLAFRFVGGEGEFRRAIIAAAGIAPGQQVLDVGCGTGTLALMMAREVAPGGRVTGTDLSREMLAVARAKDPGGSVRFMLANSEDLPFAAGSFDRVTSSLAMHEMNREGRANTLAEMRRVLAGDGLLAVADFRRPRTLPTRLGMAFVRLGETRTLTDMWRSGLRREVEEAGFAVVSHCVAGRGFFEIIAARPRGDQLPARESCSSSTRA